MSEKLTSKEFNRDLFISHLTDLKATLEERIAAARNLFSPERKKEKLATADTDSKGRPVRYFRLVTYEELRTLLDFQKINGREYSVAQEIFLKKEKEIKRALEYFLQKENIYDRFKENFEVLSFHFTLQNYQCFIQQKLPRITLFKFHIGPGGEYPGITGLYSLSVGAPYQPPYNPSKDRGRHQEGLPVVEFSIPSDEVYVHPLFKTMNIEMEKEVNTLIVKPEWIVDVYNGTKDFAERFIKDPLSVLYSEYQKVKSKDPFMMDYISDNDIWNILQYWKSQESIASLIPIKKLEDIDENNLKLQMPLRNESMPE